MTNTVDAWVFRLGTGGALLFIVSYCALYFIPFGVQPLGVDAFGTMDPFKKYSYHDVYDGVMDGLEYVRGTLFTGFGWNV